MLTIEMLPAGHGDCLIVEYGTSTADSHRVLIDAGTIHSWADEVRPRLLRLPNRSFELFVVTHVDEDHIGGSVALLEDAQLNHRIRDVWFNGFVHCNKGGNVLGPIDGERLTRLIKQGGFTWNEAMPRRISRSVGGPVVVASKGTLPAFTLPGGATITLLSPSGPKLQKMKDKWVAEIERIAKKVPGLIAGKGTDLPAGNVPRRRKDVPQAPMRLTPAALATLGKKSAADGSEANGSSIAFIFEFGGKRALLGADAHADTLVANLARYGEAVGETRVRLDVVKLAHHGSRANLTAELVGLIDAKKWLLSSNGDNFGHPDDAAIARVIVGADRKPTFYCNYRSDRTEPWVERGQSCGAKFVLPRPGKAGLRVRA